MKKKDSKKDYTLKPLFISEPDINNPALIRFVESNLIPSLQSWSAKENYDYSLASLIHSFGSSVSFVLKLSESFPVLKYSLDFAVESAKIKISESVENPKRADFLINFINTMFNCGNSVFKPEALIIFKPAESNIIQNQNPEK